MMRRVTWMLVGVWCVAAATGTTQQAPAGGAQPGARQGGPAGNRGAPPPPFDVAHPSTPLGMTLSLSKGQGAPSASRGATARASAPFDMMGYWVSVVTEDWRWRMMTPPKGDYSSVPLNNEGRRVADWWDFAKDKAEGNDCRAFGAAAVMRRPGRLHITWQDETTLRIETSAGNQTRLLRFAELQGGTAAANERSWQGTSLAEWRKQQAVPALGFGGRGRGSVAGGNLKVVTTGLRPGYLRTNGIVVFSLASLGAATSQSIVQLLMWRALLGIGMGGEWGSGAVLVSETWPPAHRNKAISIMQSGWALGYILAAVLAGIFIDTLGLGDEAWRWLFAFGAVPALLVLWVRRSVPEPAVWIERRHEPERRVNPFAVIFGREFRGRTLLIIALNSATQFGYWGIFFWLPGFLARPVEQGGAGMSVVGSIGWIIPLQVGAYVGYLTFGFIADLFGRRRTFILFMVAAALIVPIYGQMARSPVVLMLLGPLFGYVAHGYFSMFGGFIAELFPTAVRATGQGTSYNLGRLAGAVAPYTIGALATLPGVGIGLAMATTSAFFLAAALIIFALPDRSGESLAA